MRNTGWIMVVAVPATGGVAPGFAGDKTAPAVPATANVVKQQTLCPVMGGTVNKKFFEGG